MFDDAEIREVLQAALSSDAAVFSASELVAALHGHQANNGRRGMVY